jgi:integrase
MKVVAHGPLTVAKIQALKPRAQRYEVSDASSGLRLRVTPNGAKSFRWAVHTTPTKQRVITLGQWSATSKLGYLTLPEARNWLEKLKDGHRTGQLEIVEAELRKATKPPPPAPLVEGDVLTVRSVAEDFMRFMERERKRPEQVRRPVEKDILPSIGTWPIRTVDTPTCRRIVEAVVGRGSPTQAGIVYATLSQLFTFAWKRDDIDVNPMERLSDPRVLGVVKNVSQRYLSNDEIPRFWRALDAYRGMTPTIRSGLKLLLLTGVRSGELLKATWDEIDFKRRTWTIPVAHQKITLAREKRSKTPLQPWTVPLPPTALSLFDDLLGLAKGLGSPNVMASFHSKTPGEQITDKALNHAMRRLFEGEKPILAFDGERPTPHDLRRTLRTHLGDLGVAWHVAERCLNHVLPGVSPVYDVSEIFEQRRAALEKWDAHVQGLLSAHP